LGNILKAPAVMGAVSGSNAKSVILSVAL